LKQKTSEGGVSMLKVLIADDEPNIREGLVHLIDWNSYGFVVAGLAINGLEALEFIQQENPDLLITDIRMPDMDGLELIEQIRTFNDSIRIIVLSGYDTFYYAQKAIQYGAERYILKPIEEDELIECLEKIRREHEEKTSAQKEYLLAMLRAFLNGQSISSTQFVNAFPKGKYYYIFVEPCIDDSLIFTSHQEDRILEIKSAVSDFFSETANIFILPEQSGVGLVVNTDALTIYDGKVQGFAGALSAGLKSRGIYADILVGLCVDNISELVKSRDSISICRDKRFYFKAGERIITCDEDIEFSLGLSENHLPDELVKATIHGKYEDIPRAVSALCEAFRRDKVSPATVILYIDNILVELLKEIEAMGGDRFQLLVKRTMFNKIVNMTINTVRIFLEDLCKEAADILADLRSKVSSKLINDIILYVRENYHTELDLKILSKKFFKSPNHLGRMFKNSTGMSFNTFLNKVRVDEAKKLLRRSDAKIYEIAFQVGFKDPNYFCVKFEELEGMTPTQYRESSLKAIPRKKC